MDQLDQSYGSINAQCCCFNMRKAMRSVTQFYDHHLEQSGLRSTQFTILVALSSTSAKTLKEIAESLVMDRTTLTRALQILKKLRLISIAQSSDKRLKKYILTNEGRKIIAEVIPMWQVAQAKVVNDLGKNCYQSIVDDLKKLLTITNNYY
jgi:DNA-binding MarR family transcriptional regulator